VTVLKPTGHPGVSKLKDREVSSMLQDKPDYGRKKQALIAYISESRDREGNTFYEAAICDNDKDEIVKELSDYDREELEKEVLQQFPEIEIENG
jgi:hypothetical protein